MAARLNLVSASAGKRFGAWAIDRIPPVVVVGIAYGISMPAVLQAAASGSEADAAGALGGMLLWLSIAALLALAYTVWKWIWEARSGKTPGNLLLGLRTANEDGEAPGLAAIFIRGLILAVSGVVPVAGPIVVTISNLWDSNHKRQGWHDKVAKTLVLDVNAGRDPLTTGGLYGAAGFGPGGAAPQGAFAGAMAGPVNATGQAAAAPAAGGGSPFAGQQWPAFDANAAASGSIISGIPGFSAPAEPATSTTTAAGTAPATSLAPEAPASSVPGVSQAGAHADDDLAFTRVRTEAAAAAPAPATRPAGVTIRFDDGREVQVEGSALIGRNPAAAQGEDVDQLIDFADMGRSVSKTHLQLRVEGNTVWVGDRNSTNGTAVTGADGVRQQLTPGSPAQALIGDTVHFGDRSFIIGQA
ncbi:hypothetical protein D477_010306 [Arthrobacter crystallopoietes BAB-32]|uniref:FHA domain-containing protein n=1 Tax=Arthrobacter crystallopoietes BAB-32 TaxID=1246476 RepID=N1UVC1_9MICC|nr:RDD family protein [Arthrobacter crystallopoietes]EMY34336.1 hypothetical protein D477_010306 [Arthrobacter crystallopoietes BAB-32]